MVKKAALHNLGCKVNAYEAEAMREILEGAGYEIVPFTERADVYVVNTCSVTNIADRKSRQMLHRARRLNPDAIVVAAGCYAQTRGEDALSDEAVDLIVGNNQKHELISLIESHEAKRRGSAVQKAADFPGAVFDAGGRSGAAGGTMQGGSAMQGGAAGGGIPYEDLSISRMEGRARAYLKVQDGCSQFCSYCVIPYARGRARSRDREDAIGEARRLAALGCREIVITGIHLSSYGKDTGDDLLGLIGALHEVEGVSRIRLSSLEPRIVTEEFVGGLSKMPKVCPHFHLSLQSGSDAVLSRMNRHYCTAEYEEGCKILRRFYAHPAITTDVIVGFPGETDEEFAQTREFASRMGFYEMHVFSYSRRAGTRAAEMGGQVDERVKSARSAALIADSRRMSREFRDYYLGREAEALLEEPATIGGERYMLGYTPEYVRVACAAGGRSAGDMARGIVRRRLEGEAYLLC